MVYVDLGRVEGKIPPHEQVPGEVYRHGERKSSNLAVNEAVLHPGKIAHMIEFEVYIDGSFMYSQRSDGIIVATPTGSTAYSLSAGGAILTPKLNAITLVPMFPHTLSSRPIVLDADSEVRLLVSPDRTPAWDGGNDRC